MLLLALIFRNSIQQKYVVLAKNWQGFKQINDHLSWHLAHKVKFSNRAPVKRLIDTWIIYKYHKELDINSLKSNELIGIGPELIDSLHIHKTCMYEHKLVAMPTASLEGNEILTRIGSYELLTKTHCSASCLRIKKLPKQSYI